MVAVCHHPEPVFRLEESSEGFQVWKCLPDVRATFSSTVSFSSSVSTSMLSETEWHN